MPPGVGEDDTAPAVPKEEEEAKTNHPRKDEDEPRKMYARKRGMEKYGATAGCPGRSAFGAKNIAARAQHCRARIAVGIMKDDVGRERLKAEQARKQRRNEAMLEEAIRRDEKRLTEEESTSKRARQGGQHVASSSPPWSSLSSSSASSSPSSSSS